MRRVLILGANGFVGRNLSNFLAMDQGISLTLFSRRTSAIDHLGSRNNVTIIQGDYTDILNTVPIIKGQDLVYHLISASVPSSSWSQPDQEIIRNLLPSIQLLRLCSDLDVKKVVYISSGGTVYGEQPGVLNEKDKLLPFTPYGISKVAVEHYLDYFKRKENLNYDIYRLSNPYGLGLEKLGFGVINTWVKAAQEDKEIVLYGDGSVAKDYIFIQDAIFFIAQSVYQDLNSCNVLNVNSGETVTLREIIETISKVSGKELRIDSRDSLVSDNKIVKLDNSKLLKSYPDFVFTPLERGIAILWSQS